MKSTVKTIEKQNKKTNTEKQKKTVSIAGREYKLKKSKYCVNYSPVHVSDNMSGKMEFIPAISTSIVLNTFCQARQKINGSICSNCYAQAIYERYSENSDGTQAAFAAACDNNYYLLTGSVLPAELLPQFKAGVQIARIEAFADVQNETQAENYVNIIKKNNHVVFGWWSKNIDIIDKILQRTGKPKNLVLIQSSLFVNRPEKKRSQFVDRVFTVYNDAFLCELDIIKECLSRLQETNKKAAKKAVQNIFEKYFINCGGRACNACRQCYNTENKTENIKERLK